MIMSNLSRGSAKGLMICLVFLCLFIFEPASHAAYEISITPVNAPTIGEGTYTKWTNNITLQWTAPTMTSPDVLMGYVYKWNNSMSPLDNNTLNVNDGYHDGNVLEPQVTNLVNPASELATLDSGSLLVLHVKTFYLTNSNPTYSDDVVYGPFLIDNVAPTGTIQIYDANGNLITSTSNTQVYLRLAASKDPTAVYLSETDLRPTDPSLTPFPTTDVVWNVSTTTGT